MSVGSSSHTSSHVATSFAPCFMSVLGAQGILRGHVSGNCIDVAILLDRTARRNARSTVLGSFDHQNSDAHST